MNIATCLTLSRIVLLPLGILPVFLGWDERWLILAGVNALAGASDFADGYLARRFNLSTSRGASLDFISDKIHIVGMLVTLAAMGAIALWIPLVIIGREVAIVLLRMKKPGSGALGSDIWGKTKTFISFLAIGWVALNESFRSDSAIGGLYFGGLEGLLSIAPWVVVAAVALTIFSGLNYAYKYASLKTSPQS